MDLNKRLKDLRECAIKYALKSPVIRFDKNLIKNLSEKKTLMLECQIMAINKVDSFSEQLKENWINTCKHGLQMMYDNEVDELAKVSLYVGEIWQMKYFKQSVKEGNFKNKEALELIANNMKPQGGNLII